MTANNVIFGIKDREGNRIDVPDSTGALLPVVLRVGPNMTAASDRTTPGEQQILIDSLPLVMSGNGFEQPGIVKSIVLGSELTATYDAKSKSATLSAVDNGDTILVAGGGFPYPIAVRQLTLSTNLTAAYDTGNQAAVISAAGGGGGTGELPLGSQDTVYSSTGSTNYWSGFPDVQGVTFRRRAASDAHLVSVGGSGCLSDSSTYGWSALSPIPYDQSVSLKPRNTKVFGSFVISGTDMTKVLTFSSTIGGVAVPANSALTGTFMLGWRGTRSGSPYNSGAMSFLINIVTDGSGVLSQYRTGVTGSNYATQSAAYTFGISASDLATSMSAVDGAVPGMFSIALDGGDFLFEVGSANTYGASDVFKFYWEFSYGFGGAA